MSGIIKKSLLIKYQQSDRTCVQKNFTVLKYSYSPYSAKFELQIPVFTSNKLCDLLLYNGKQSEVFEFFGAANKSETFEFGVNFSVCDGIGIAVFDKTNGTPLFYGNNLKSATLPEMIQLYEKNYKTNDKKNDNEEKSVFLPEKADELSESAYAEKSDELTDENILAPEETAETNEIYDDEAVATENYFEDELKYCEVENDSLSDAAFNAEPNDENNKEQTQSDSDIKQNDSHLRACPFIKRQPRFYEEKHDEIEQLFNKYPPISSLSQYIPESKWIKIGYKKDGYYIIGVIKKADVPLYIVYGVPGNREFRPRGFEKYSVFLPESLFASNDRGFWCTFQDAESGEIQNPETPITT